MKKRCFLFPLILSCVSLGFLAVPMPVRAQAEYRGSFSTRQRGYEHGYRDGVIAGLHDYREHRSYHPQEHDQWKDADHSYDKAFGNKAEYKQTYRTAYENGETAIVGDNADPLDHRNARFGRLARGQARAALLIEGPHPDKS